MALDLSQKFVSAQYLENKWTEFHQIFICIHIDNIYLGISSRHFLQIFTRVMALDLRRNFVSAQYLEQIDRISSNFKYAFILTKSSLLQSYFPLLMSEFVPVQYL